jgi:serine/threonine protein kinase
MNEPEGGATSPEPGPPGRRPTDGLGLGHSPEGDRPGQDAPGPPLPRDIGEVIRRLEGARPAPGNADPFTPRDPVGFVDAMWSSRERPSRFGRFEVRGELGRGGAGVVLLAIDTALGRRVALKLPRPEAMLDPEARTRFLFGAYGPAMLDHPNIIAVYEIGQVGPIPYIVFAYHPGHDLAAWLVRRETPVPIGVASGLIAELCSGVQHLHDRGFLHRDITPANILVAPMPGGGYRPKLLDFELALLPGDDRETVPDSATFGTPAYMAPEQIAGRHDDLGQHTDLYAVGAVLYELLAGFRPFDGVHGADLRQIILDDEPPPPVLLRPDLPPELARLCSRCLSKRPGDRPASAREIRESLLPFCRDAPSPAGDMPSDPAE